MASVCSSKVRKTFPWRLPLEKKTRCLPLQVYLADLSRFNFLLRRPLVVEKFQANFNQSGKSMFSIDY